MRFLKLHICDSDILNHVLTELSLSVFPSNVILCGTVSVGDAAFLKKHILLVPELSSKLLMPHSV